MQLRLACAFRRKGGLWIVHYNGNAALIYNSLDESSRQGYNFKLRRYGKTSAEEGGGGEGIRF